MKPRPAPHNRPASRFRARHAAWTAALCLGLALLGGCAADPHFPDSDTGTGGGDGKSADDQRSAGSARMA